MKQPKKLLRHQKEILTKKGYNWEEWMLHADDKDTFTIVNKQDPKRMIVFNY